MAGEAIDLTDDAPVPKRQRTTQNGSQSGIRARSSNDANGDISIVRRQEEPARNAAAAAPLQGDDFAVLEDNTKVELLILT